MSHADQLPAFAAIVVAALVLAGAALALIGSIGLLRLKTFYERVHAPTLGTTLGTGFVLIASMVLFSVLESRPVLHEVLIGVFMVLNTPVTFMLLLRAALHRDRAANAAESSPQAGEAAAALSPDISPGRPES
jgi:multicomponent K+:H+ antiporter subunit G